MPRSPSRSRTQPPRRSRRRVGALAEAIAAVQGELAAIYRLELPMRAERFLVSAAEAQRHLAASGASTGPRTGVVAVEDREALWLGLYFAPEDRSDPAAILEETSHWMALVWHAAQDRRVRPLELEFQAEVDRYAVARSRGRAALSHFGAARWRPDLAPEELDRYRTAHHAAARYCEQLERRFPRRADLPGWLAELRRFYRAGPERLRA
ncbi:MAG: hypothetical protein AAF430_10430 [Myxococcota bacterium]